ncbi:MAG: YceI family protein [Bacteroidota bacterium]
MRTLLKFSFAFMLLALLASCGGDKAKAAKTTDAVDAEATKTAASKSYALSEGTVHWTGSKIVGDDHKGTLNVTSGELSAEGNKIVSGNFTIDMKSLNNTDLAGDPDSKAKLEGHLKGADFFDVEKFPAASFAVTSVKEATGESSNYEITGNLTMKGETKSITFPALVMAKDGGLTAHTDKFTINRTDWGVKYGSGLLGVAKDKAISDDVVLEITLMAK